MEHKKMKRTTGVWGNIGFLMIIIGFIVVAFQLINYLKMGYWTSISVIYILKIFNDQWALYPSDWVGLYEILNGIPFSIFCIVEGILLAFDYNSD